VTGEDPGNIDVDGGFPSVDSGLVMTPPEFGADCNTGDPSLTRDTRFQVLSVILP